MLLRCIRAENRKLHASPIWFMFFILPIISAGYGTFNYLQNLEILRDGWYSLWTQHTLFYSLFFFPCMVLRPGVRRVHSAPAGHYHLLPGAQCTGRAGRGGGAAAIFHGDPQLCLAGVFGAGRGCFRHAAGQPGLLVRLALLPDAARHER